MKWGNRNINVVEQPKIPKFSKLDYIGTPLTLCDSFFNDALIGMVVGYIKYDHREKEDTSLEITN